MNDTEAKQRRINEINDILSPLIEERSRLRLEITAAKSPFIIGDVIRWKSHNGYRRGRVYKIAEWCCGSPMWIVRRIRNDGSEGSECKVRPYNDPSLEKGHQ